MDDKYMGQRCKFSNECHIYKGIVELKQPLFIVKNIYCNNGSRWWSRCQVYTKFMAGEEVEKTLIPTEDLRKE